MTKLSRILMFLVCLLTSSTWVTQAYGQLISLAPSNIAGATTQVRAPNGTAAAMRAVVVVTPTELTPVLGASNSINSLGFNLEARPLPNAMSGTVNIYMVNSTNTTNTRGTDWTVAITGMTQVCTNCAFTVAPSATSYDITLTTPFAYTGQGMYVAYDFTITSTLFPAPTAPTDPIATYLANNALGASTASYQGVAPASNTLGTPLSGFRPEFRFGTPCTPVTVTPTPSSLSFTSGAAITPITLGASGIAGATYTYAILPSPAALPAGLTLVAGVISGTPIIQGTGTFTVRATSTPGGCTGNAVYSFTVGAPVPCTPVVITPVTGPVVFATGSFITPIVLSASGGPAGATTYTYSVPTATLPAGLTLLNGVISGIPTTVGTGSFTVTATSAVGSCPGTATYNFTVNLVCTPVVVTPTAGALNLVSGTAITQITINATGGSAGATYTYAITSGALPDGLTFVPATRIISGIPTAAAVGTGSFTVTATSASTSSALVCAGSAIYTFTVLPACTPVVITPLLSALNFLVGAPITSITLAATGGDPSATYTYAILTGAGSPGPLPAGLTLLNGVISGTPAGAVGTSGSFTVVATSTTSPVTRSCTGNATYTYAIKSDCAVVLAATGLPEGIVGSPYTHTFVATGGVTYAFTTSTPLPAGLTLDIATGVLSGTPTAPANITLLVTAKSPLPSTCSATLGYGLTVKLNSITAIDNSLANLVKVSPNPSKGDFNVDFSTINMAKSSVRVYDAQGKVVFTSENNTSASGNLMTISLEKFANGIYLMEVETSKGRILKRLAKQ